MFKIANLKKINFCYHVILSITFQINKISQVIQILDTKSVSINQSDQLSLTQEFLRVLVDQGIQLKVRDKLGRQHFLFELSLIEISLRSWLPFDKRRTNDLFIFFLF